MQDLARHSHFQDHVVHKDWHQKHMVHSWELLVVADLSAEADRFVQGMGLRQPQAAQSVEDTVVAQHLAAVGIDWFADRSLVEWRTGRSSVAAGLQHIVVLGYNCPRMARDHILLLHDLKNVN